MSRELLDAVVIETEGAPLASVIWLHGLGADGHDFPPIVPALGVPKQARVRFVFPHAPMRPVTINGGMTMRAWYDIKSMDLERHVEQEHLEASREQVEAWIAHERELGIPSERIVLAGFSQGGAIVLYAGLQFGERLGGILALSCYHPMAELIETRAADANRRVPIFMAHGTRDPVVPIHLAEATIEKLRANGYEPEWHAYPMPHSVAPEEVKDIARWLLPVVASV
jgi:phospholipase/carboxylesterase